MEFNLTTRIYLIILNLGSVNTNSVNRSAVSVVRLAFKLHRHTTIEKMLAHYTLRIILSPYERCPPKKNSKIISNTVPMKTASMLWDNAPVWVFLKSRQNDVIWLAMK